MKKHIKLATVNPSEPVQPEQPPNQITHRLKPKKREDCDTRSMSNADKSLSTNQLLSSFSTKLNPRSISISSQSKELGVRTEKVEIKVSCLDQLLIPKFKFYNSDLSLSFERLKHRAELRKVPSIVYTLGCLQKNKKTCSESNCELKIKWKSKLVGEAKDFEYASHLYSLVQKHKTNYDQQIQKDVIRSFPERHQVRAKITLYHASEEKSILIANLGMVLRMLVVMDPDVGYIQGMNLYAAVVVTHVKEVLPSFMFVKEVMKYGKMRQMYVNNFKNMKELCYNLLHRHIKLLLCELYDIFMENGVTSQFFMPFYLSMFACVVDFNAMPCIIDEFMAKGFIFLDKLMLSMLCFLKPNFFDCDPGEVACRLGASYIRSCSISWGEVINLTQVIDLN